MPINFKGIPTTRKRRYEDNYIARINEGLKTLSVEQRAAIIGTIIEESGGNPLAVSPDGAYKGLLQWGADRYVPKSTNADEELNNQIQYILSTVNNPKGGINWTHGGKGSGYNTLNDAYKIFTDGNLPFKDRYRAFSYGYVRPAGKENSYNNRLKVAKEVLNRLVVGEQLTKQPQQLPLTSWGSNQFPNKFAIGGDVYGTVIPLGRIHIDENGNMVDLLDGKEYTTSATNGRDVVITGKADHWKEAGKRSSAVLSPYSSLSQVAKDMAYDKLDDWVDKNVLQPNDYDIGKIRRKLFYKLDPWGYDEKDDFGNVIITPEQKIRTALNDRTPDRDLFKNNSIIKRNPIYAKYLGLEKYNNGYGEVNTDDALEVLKYQPTIGNQGHVYYKSPTEEDDFTGPFSVSKLGRFFRQRDSEGENTFVAPDYDDVMGNYTISFGRDKKGKYISYYDTWDLNPFEGTAIENGDIDERYGIGKPVHLYGRKYYTDKDSANIVNRYKHLNALGNGGYLNTGWDSLSMQDKAEMMKVAVANGITTLPEIRQAYNEFAKGGKTNWTMEDEAGYRYWRSRLPRNLRETNDNDYDMRAAYKAGMQPEWNNEDKAYHLGSRDPRTGRILKAPHHPTYLKALLTDASLGYYPMTDGKGNTYTQTWKGNNVFADGGYVPSDSIKARISNWEGSSMKTNRSFEAEAKDFNKVIPADIRKRLSPNQLDALYSYGYNVGMGKLKERVLPTLTAYTHGKASKEDVQKSMWATKDSQLRGLTTRRNAEREMFGGNYRTSYNGKSMGIHIDPQSFQLPQGFFETSNIEIPQMQVPVVDVDPTTLYKAPTIDDTLFANPKPSVDTPIYSPRQERLEGIQRLNTVMGLMGQETPFGNILGKSDAPGLLSYVGAIYGS